MLRRVFPACRKGPAAVLIGGGAPHRLLSSLRRWTTEITYIAPATDSGGNSGILAGGLGFPPGDIRRGTAGLAGAVMQGLSDLFPVRFDGRFRGLEGYCFGNIVYCALQIHLEETIGRATPKQIIDAVAGLMRIRGCIYPATYERVRLAGETWQGDSLWSEAAIGESSQPMRRVWLDPGTATPVAEALEAIRNADIILLGPTSLYTSLLPILLVPGFAAALTETKARRFLIVNVAAQAETRHLHTASAYITVLQDHFPKQRLFDHAVLNTGVPLPLQDIQSTDFVRADPEAVCDLGYSPVLADLLCRVDPRHHNADRLMRLIKSVVSIRPKSSAPFCWRSDMPFSHKLSRSSGIAGRCIPDKRNLSAAHYPHKALRALPPTIRENTLPDADASLSPKPPC